MKYHPITAAAVHLLNAKLDALPMSRYGSRQKFLKAAGKLAGASDEQMRKILSRETPSVRIDYLYALAEALGEDPLALLAEAGRLYADDPARFTLTDVSRHAVVGQSGEDAPQESELADQLSRMVDSQAGEIQTKRRGARQSRTAAPKADGDEEPPAPRRKPHAI